MLLNFTTPEGRFISEEIKDLVVAGWAGRDADAIEHHIEELAALGIPRPSAVPLYYRVAAQQLSQSEYLQVLGAESSGEVEVFAFSCEDIMYVSIASDHTDRKLEAYSVAFSKQACVKPVAKIAWRLDEVMSHWDDLVIRSWVEEGGVEVLYQEGTLASLRTPLDLIAGYADGRVFLPKGCGMICGTVGAIGGIRPARQFIMELHDPHLNRSIRHRYTTEYLNIIF